MPNSITLLDSTYYYSWDQNTNSWTNSYKELNFYNSDGDDTIKYAYYYDSNSSIWNPVSKEAKTYNSNGDLSIYTNFYWDSNNNEWDTSYQTLYYYTNLNKDVIYKNFDPNTQTLVNSSKESYINNLNGQDSVYIYITVGILIIMFGLISLNVNIIMIQMAMIQQK